ncbi:hypothetical protein, partial [Anaerococcus sp. HMSC068A02]|uniref:hypothetical protein n=1 Tax=Anaerococcus sp. HMSC068A02 TaxID=1739286 RepID=UPI001C99B586
VRAEEMGEFRFSPFFLPLTTPTFLPPCNRPLHGANFVRSFASFKFLKLDCYLKIIINSSELLEKKLFER